MFHQKRHSYRFSFRLLPSSLFLSHAIRDGCYTEPPPPSAPLCGLYKGVGPWLCLDVSCRCLCNAPIFSPHPPLIWFLTKVVCFLCVSTTRWVSGFRNGILWICRLVKIILIFPAAAERTQFLFSRQAVVPFLLFHCIILTTIWKFSSYGSQWARYKALLLLFIQHRYFSDHHLTSKSSLFRDGNW